jgi:hypothetical protein
MKSSRRSRPDPTQPRGKRLNHLRIMEWRRVRPLVRGSLLLVR